MLSAVLQPLSDTTTSKINALSIIYVLTTVILIAKILYLQKICFTVHETDCQALSLAYSMASA